MSKRKPQLYFQDILDSILKIEEFTKDFNFDQFQSDEKTVEAVIRKLEIIGEAVKNLPNETIENHPEIPWSKIKTMRNKVLHEYFGVDVEIVWKTIKEDLSSLKEQIKNIVK